LLNQFLSTAAPYVTISAFRISPHIPVGISALDCLALATGLLANFLILELSIIYSSPLIENSFV